MTPIDEPAFYLMTPSMQGVEVDVICAHTEHNINTLLNLRRNCPWVSFVRVNAATAFKVLVEDNGVGIGCYAPTTNADENLRRRTISKLKHLTLARFARGMDVYEPVVVREPIPRIVRNVVLTLFNRKS